VREDPARQELAELLLDELRQACANGAAGGFREKRLQVLADDRVKDTLLGRVGPGSLATVTKRSRARKAKYVDIDSPYLEHHAAEGVLRGAGWSCRH
jgi:hypothetical protein